MNEPGARTWFPSFPPALRNAIASLLALAAAYGLATSIRPSKSYVLAVPLSLLLASSLLVHRAGLGPQILARAVWWSNLALGVVLSLSGHGRELQAGGILTLACGGALLVAGRRALGDENAKAAAVPAALRSVLLLLMVFALADAQTFLLFGSAGVIESSSKLGVPAVMLAIGLVYVVGFVGLYRLRLWGAIVNVTLSIGVLGLVVGTESIQKDELRAFLGVLALVQILVGAPVTVAALQGKMLPGLPAGVRGIAANAVVAALMLLSLFYCCKG